MLHPDVAFLDSTRRGLSIRHLLTMTSGFLWNEIGGNAYSDWILSGDHVLHVVNQPITDHPGTSFNYNSGAVHILGVLLHEAVEMPLPDFADEYLFDKIGIQRRRWETLTRGYVNGVAGIDLLPRDLGRLGQFYLQAGSTGRREILPQDWVAEVREPRFEWRSTYGPLNKLTYGYLCGLRKDNPRQLFCMGVWGSTHIRCSHPKSGGS